LKEKSGGKGGIIVQIVVFKILMLNGIVVARRAKVVRGQAIKHDDVLGTLLRRSFNSQQPAAAVAAVHHCSCVVLDRLKVGCGCLKQPLFLFTPKSQVSYV
jgi:hypothetical protein